jgi:UDP-2,4-diacetamido-2,4,6-trideoxy-beta-L-altropyranose hydrolase
VNREPKICEEPLIAFRVDASTEIGTGHVMRCLTLADALSGLGARTEFICRPHAGNLIGEIEKRGYRAIVLPAITSQATDTGDTANAHAHWLGTTAAQDAQDTIDALESTILDWLITDHYGLDARWERALRPTCSRVMVIDDLANRPPDCDLLVDHGLEHGLASYADLVAQGKRLLCGTQYAPLGPEFAQMRVSSLARREQPALRHILVSMGGVDKQNATSHVLEALADSRLALCAEFTVVMGPQAPWLGAVRKLCAAIPLSVKVLAGTTQMARLMHDADLAIGAGGTTSWERCCLGLPSIVLVLAKNQAGVAASLERAGAALAVHETGGFSQVLGQHIVALTAPGALSNMVVNAAQITDGRGADRIAAWLMAGDSAWR